MNHINLLNKYTLGFSIIGFLIASIIKNKQGNNVGSLYLKLSHDKYFHIHHWVWVIVLIIFILLSRIRICDEPGPVFYSIIGALIGYGISGLVSYNDCFHFIEDGDSVTK